MLKILSLDGGPGPLMELRVIERLQRIYEREGRGSFLDEVDLFAGTSNGGLMALYFAKELSQAAEDRAAGRPARTATEIIERCKRFSDLYAASLAASSRHLAGLALAAGALREIDVARRAMPTSGALWGFVRERLGTVASAPGCLLGSLGDLWAMRNTLRGVEPIARAEVFRQHMREAFGDWTLGRLQKKVVVLSFDATSWKPRAFRNFGAADREGTADRGRDLKLSLVEVGMCTAAMPLFLPVFGGSTGHGYLDGIFSANNPCTSAVTLAMRHLFEGREGEALHEIVALSMGVSQTTEEANIEHAGGALALLDLVAVDDRTTRMLHSIKPGERERYLRDVAWRLERQLRPERKSVGAQPWGWRDYVRRPTFVVNMLVHGMNGESSAQSARLLRDRFFRHAPRINLARALFRTVLLGRTVDGTDLPWNAARCFAPLADDGSAPVATGVPVPYSGDEVANVRETRALMRWLDRHWFDGAGDEAGDDAHPAKGGANPSGAPLALSDLKETQPTMCRRVTCPRCEKATYAGCGMHVEQVLGGVPMDQRCSCRESPQPAKSDGAKRKGWWPFG